MKFKIHRYRNALPRWARISSGILAILFYSLHSLYLIMNSDPAHMLWSCHIAALGIGFGLFFEIPLLIAVGVLWLGFGDIMWGLYLLGGGGFEPTSPLTHIGALGIGVFALSKTGFPSKSWLWAIAGLLCLQQISRWFTPEALNINLAFRVHEGWEPIFPSYGLYLTVLSIISGGFFFLLEKLFSRIFSQHNRDLI